MESAHVPRVLVGTVVCALAAIGLGAAPAIAAAAPSSVTITCTGSSLSTSTTAITAVAGDKVTFSFSDYGGCSETSSVRVRSLIGSSEANLLSITQGSSAVVDLDPSWTGLLVKALSGGPYTAAPSIALTFTTDGGGGSDGDSDGSSSTEPVAESALPAPVVQEFGRPAAGTCDAAAPASLNWANVGSGGWGQSWSQWMNDGAGGFVCSRTLVYSNSLGGWTIA